MLMAILELGNQKLIDDSPFVWKPLYPIITPYDIKPQHRITYNNANETLRVRNSDI